jgi:hypothetical protein
MAAEIFDESDDSRNELKQRANSNKIQVRATIEIRQTRVCLIFYITKC